MTRPTSNVVCNIAPRAESSLILNAYMGKNTPERKDYIMDKLVVPVEE